VHAQKVRSVSKVSIVYVHRCAPHYCRALRCLHKHAPTAVLGMRQCGRQLLLRLLLHLQWQPRCWYDDAAGILRTPHR
jgi:hypothetical protein